MEFNRSSDYINFNVQTSHIVLLFLSFHFSLLLPAIPQSPQMDGWTDRQVPAYAKLKQAKDLWEIIFSVG